MIGVDWIRTSVSQTLDWKDKFPETLENFQPQTEKQRKAADNIKWLLRLIKDTNWKPQKPIMFMLHWWPWRWKTHLLNAFLNEVAKLWHSYSLVRRPETTGYGNINYSKDIIVIDDLFSAKQSLSTNFQSYEYGSIERMIFEVYEWKKILLMTSNFSLEDLINMVNKFDEKWRIKSRIKEFIWFCPDMELDWDDFREKIWKEWDNPFEWYFS